VEKAVKEAKQEPKLFFAHYIWQVLLRGSGDLARRAAVPLLLHARFGPVPIGVTYVTKAVKNGVWRFLKPEELLGAGLEFLREDELEPIANWLAQQHEDLVEEMLRDLAGLNGEEAREPYRETLSDLIKALNWTRDEALKEGNKILAEFGIPMETLKVYSKILTELGVPEEDWELWTALLAFVARRLAAVFESGESRRCWKRAALVAGHALAGHLVLLTTKPPEHVAETLGDALKPCVVDDYLTIDGEIPWLSICIAQLMPIKELNILSPYTDVEIIKAAKKTAEELMKQWRRRGGFSLTEVIYALGLATLATGAEVDEETADLLLYTASAAVQRVTHPVAVLPILAALRPLGEKAPHIYVFLLAAASELETPYPETAWYIYDALQQLKDRLTETGRLWPLVEAIRAYSNLLRKHLTHIEDRQEEAVADMCELYSMVRGRSAAAASESDLSAHRLFDAVARTNVLAVALGSDVLAQHVQRHCGLGDLEEEAKDVMIELNKAADHPEELRKIMENDKDFADWVTARSVTGDAGLLIEDLRAWLTYELASYKLDHAIDEKGELDAEKLEEVAKEFEKAAEISRKLKLWENYLTVRSWALRARVLAAKSWEELLERAKGFWELWREAEKYPEPTTGYFVAANLTLGQCLVYLVASGNRERAEELLKKWRWLLDYDPEVSVVTRLMLKLFGVGEGARLKDVVDVFGPRLPPEFWPTLLMLTGRLQKEEALELCKKLPKSEVCVNAVMFVAGDQEAAEKLKLEIKSETPETRPLRIEVDGRTLVEVLTTTSSHARLAFMLLAAVEGRADAVRLHGLLGSVTYVGNVNQPLFRAVYETCVDLNSEGCKTALLKLYYYHF
jgi:tetratricopeptide (TPR) repeat protein